MKSEERALRLIVVMNTWEELPDPSVSEAGRAEKARLIAEWGLNGEVDKLAQAEDWLDCHVTRLDV